MLHIPEKAFFDSQQSLLLRMAATRYGRELLCITDMGEVPVVVRPNMVQWRQSGRTRLSEFRAHNKYAKVIRHHWKEYQEYSDALVKEGLEESWREHRRSAAKLGIVFVGGGTVTTVYPDPHPETNTVDGFVQRAGVSESFATIIAGAGTFSRDTDTSRDTPHILASATTDEYERVQRLITLFDTSSIPDADSIDSAIYSLYAVSVTNELNGESSENSRMHCVQSTPASDTALVNADYGQLGSVSFGTSALQVDLNTGAYNDITLNASGLAEIDATELTRLGAVYGWDFNATTTGLTWASGAEQRIVNRFADSSGTDSDPRLEVTHSAAGTEGPLVGGRLIRGGILRGGVLVRC